jgi:hypothetical protein
MISTLYSFNQTLCESLVSVAPFCFKIFADVDFTFDSLVAVGSINQFEIVFRDDYFLMLY